HPGPAVTAAREQGMCDVHDLFASPRAAWRPGALETSALRLIGFSGHGATLPEY
ncbi:MAG: hypothetical protein JWP34_5194, partial [Massilia sp.]|nr:hypothetical protein [Massilia sp.]